MSDQVFRPIVSQRLPAFSHFAELYTAAGPQQLYVTGDNSYSTLYGRNWLLVADDSTGALRLYAAVPDGGWQEVLIPGHPVIGQVRPPGARRYALAFDQAAAPVCAYELPGPLVKVTRWSPSGGGYITDDLPGVADPQLLMDATVTGAIPGSDVVLFGLSPDRERVYARVQRDLFAVPELLYDFGAPVILDRVTALPLRYQLLLSDARGTPLPEMLVSDLYPYALGNAVFTGAAPARGGALVPVTINVPVESRPLEVRAVPGGWGALLDAVVSTEASSAPIAVEASPALTGSLGLLVEIVEADGVLVKAELTPAGAGELRMVVLNHEVVNGRMSVAVLPATEGSYETA